jgi:glyoxylase-like metal-dependent hydrolase (beta-lactamase superfamily II)
VTPAVGAWYEQARVNDHLVRLGEPHVGDLLSANLWWLHGTERDVVVDAGLGVVDLRDAVPDLFEREPLVLLTHSHLDHVGGANAFRERAAHPAEAAVLARGVPASLRGPELYEKLGLDAAGEAIPELLIDALPHPDYDPATYRVGPIALTRQLDEGDRVDLGDRELTVLHLPGHTPGSIALLDEHNGTLFSGDVVYDGYLIDDLPESEVTAYRSSMERLAHLDVSTVHPGHGSTFDGSRLRELTAAYLRASSG